MKLLPATLCFALVLAQPATAALHVVIVEGLGGENAYAEAFARQVVTARRAAASLTDDANIRVFSADEANRDAILAHFGALRTSTDENDQLLVYLIGHGSYDDVEYKFNIPGPDLSDSEIAAALEDLPCRSQVVINTSSASGAAAESLQADHRIVISATRSGVERHATRFGAYFTAALEDPTADVDKNRLISVQEAFDFADRQVGDYFESNGQLATEHARLDGQRAGRFSLARLGSERPVTDDREMLELIARRELLQQQVDSLRLSRDSLAADSYQEQLLESMLELAQVEEEIEFRQSELDAIE